MVLDEYIRPLSDTFTYTLAYGHTRAHWPFAHFHTHEIKYRTLSKEYTDFYFLIVARPWASI